MKMTVQTEITLPVTLVCDVDSGPAGPHHTSDGSWAEPDDRGVELLGVRLQASNVRSGLDITEYLTAAQLQELAQEASELAAEGTDEE